MGVINTANGSNAMKQTTLAFSGPRPKVVWQE
jgi:hypothetical protein